MARAEPEGFNADLHIHSRFSAATSRQMDFRVLARGAKEKGIHIVGTGDCLHPGWRREMESLERVDDGTMTLDGVFFIPTVEVEDRNRVHHLLLFPSLSKADEYAGMLEKEGVSLEADGRPTLPLGGEEIAEMARDTEALIGPCHAFTPWTALYAYHDSLEDCYGSMAPHVSFVELGLSADTGYADRISELHRLTFLTNSDAHSASPHRLAREFNRLEIEEATADEVRKALLRTGGRGVVLNVGLPPQEGKYNETACVRCYTHYPLEEAKRAGWRCPCGGQIKKGVRDRVE
ncbi:MAG: phosphotransferase, partial [Thermoplasmata archaeon]|nr:phosphotransferase [Thermoplasmata archaeon]